LAARHQLPKAVPQAGHAFPLFIQALGGESTHAAALRGLWALLRLREMADTPPVDIGTGAHCATVPCRSLTASPEALKWTSAVEFASGIEARLSSLLSDDAGRVAAELSRIYVEIHLLNALVLALRQLGPAVRVERPPVPGAKGGAGLLAGGPRGCRLCACVHQHQPEHRHLEDRLDASGTRRSLHGPPTRRRG
jgi:hypothetical protein